MDCPYHDPVVPMVKLIRINGQVYWKCKLCGHEIEAGELEPPYDGWNHGFEREE